MRRRVFFSANTASEEVRKRVYSRPRDTNFAWPPLCPSLASKRIGSLPYASAARARTALPAGSALAWFGSRPSVPARANRTTARCLV